MVLIDHISRPATKEADRRLSSDRVIAITAADARYFQYAAEAITSIRAQCCPGLALGFLDLGLQNKQIGWLQNAGVEVRAPQSTLCLPTTASVRLDEMGYLARPFLREVFPGYHVYVWLDADAWIQTGDALETLISEARRHGAALIRQNEKAYRFWPWQVGWIHKHYTSGYGFLRGLGLAWRPMINNGVFAMRHDFDLWERWQARYQSALNRTGRTAPHDQFGLNAAVYMEGMQVSFLPATFNWICDLAQPMWDTAAERFCAPYPPYDPIAILHLAGPAKTRIFDIRTTEGNIIRRTLRYEAEDREHRVDIDAAV